MMNGENEIMKIRLSVKGGYGCGETSTFYPSYTDTPIDQLAVDR